MYHFTRFTSFVPGDTVRHGQLYMLAHSYFVQTFIYSYEMNMRSKKKERERVRERVGREGRGRREVDKGNSMEQINA